jgi:hypothetical protein
LQRGFEIGIAFAGKPTMKSLVSAMSGAPPDALDQAAIIVALCWRFIASSTASDPDCTGRCR